MMGFQEYAIHIKCFPVSEAITTIANRCGKFRILECDPTQWTVDGHFTLLHNSGAYLSAHGVKTPKPMSEFITIEAAFCQRSYSVSALLDFSICALENSDTVVSLIEEEPIQEFRKSNVSQLEMKLRESFQRRGEAWDIYCGTETILLTKEQAASYAIKRMIKNQ